MKPVKTNTEAVYITTSIPYVNAYPHIGYALEVVQADALKRWHELRRNDDQVRLLAGTDENAIKNVESAEKEGMEPQQFVNRNADRFEALLKDLNISNDDFIRTSSGAHKSGSQRLWTECLKHNPDHIYAKDYVGLYCVGCETFYKDGEFENNICPHHNRKLETVTEKNWFFKLTAYKEYLKDLIGSDTLKIHPAYRKQEVLNMIDDLEDISISRPVERTKGWGVPVPGDDSQMMYVWFDALANYITALDFEHDGEAYQSLWAKNPTNKYHCIGKDIIKFHALYWPAMLKCANIIPPNTLYVHGFITVDGKKMSKSIGNVIDPFEMVKKYGLDAVRYYLLREIPALDDGDFSMARMEEIYKSDLANELGNLVMRITTIAVKDGIDRSATDNSPARLVYKEGKYADLFESFQFPAILEQIWLQIKELNKSTDTFAPWKKTPDERRAFLIEALDKLSVIGELLQPFMPNAAEKIRNATYGVIQKAEPLFPRLP